MDSEWLPPHSHKDRGGSSSPGSTSPPQLQHLIQHASSSSRAITQPTQYHPAINALTSSTRAPLSPSCGVPISFTSVSAPETRKPPHTEILPVVWDSVKLISRVGASSAEAFAPAKAAVVGVKEILTIWKVSYPRLLPG